MDIFLVFFVITALRKLLLLLRKQLVFFLGGRWSLQGFGQMWRLSYPDALEQLVRQAAVLAFLWSVVRYGTAAFAAYGAGIMLMACPLYLAWASPSPRR